MMAKRPSSSGPITIKGTRGNDILRIDPTHPDQSRGFIIEGLAGDDELEGGTGVDRLLGGAGFDDLWAQKEDLLGAAAAGKIAYDGGADLDILRFDKWTENVGIDLGYNNISGDVDRFYTGFTMVRSGVRTTLEGATQYQGLTTSIEGVIGGSGDDLLNGDVYGNYLEGGPGNDHVDGKRGADQLVGGAGDDHIWIYGGDLVSGDYTDTVPVTFPPGAPGNDSFFVGGGDVGAYYVNRITDFDTRTSESDTQFDQLWINTNFTYRFDYDAEAGVLRLIWTGSTSGDLGEVIFDGLTDLDIPFIPIVTWDPMTGMPV
jgi:Ca2+-binding RTX toxin-like protein